MLNGDKRRPRRDQDTTGRQASKGTTDLAHPVCLFGRLGAICDTAFETVAHDDGIPDDDDDSRHAADDLTQVRDDDALRNAGLDLAALDELAESMPATPAAPAVSHSTIEVSPSLDPTFDGAARSPSPAETKPANQATNQDISLPPSAGAAQVGGRSHLRRAPTNQPHRIEVPNARMSRTPPSCRGGSRAMVFSSSSSFRTPLRTLSRLPCVASFLSRGPVADGRRGRRTTQQFCSEAEAGPESWPRVVGRPRGVSAALRWLKTHVRTGARCTIQVYRQNCPRGVDT